MLEFCCLFLFTVKQKNETVHFVHFQGLFFKNQNTLVLLDCFVETEI